MKFLQFIKKVKSVKSVRSVRSVRIESRKNGTSPRKDLSHCKHSLNCEIPAIALDNPYTSYTGGIRFYPVEITSLIANLTLLTGGLSRARPSSRLRRRYTRDLYILRRR
jgi:hypothetical protein